jgi:uncharacterized protein 26
MKKYVFNTTILTNSGTYRLSDISTERAKEILSDNDFISAIGHDSTAEIISSVLGINVPMNRINASFEEVGDLAICFKLNSRPKEGSILSLEDLQEIGFSWKLLKRIE